MTVKGQKRISRIGKAAAMLLAAAVCFCSAAFSASAAGEKVVSSTTDGQNVYLYVKGVSEITGGTVQIGNAVCPNVSVGKMDAFATPMRTVILIDNSRSIKQDRRADIRVILDALVDNAMEGEVFRVGIFSEEVTWLCEDTTDHDVVSQALDAVVYENQDTYFSDCLYGVIEDMAAGSDATYSRIVIVSDGADNKTIGYTNSEVATLVERKNIPVYTIGTLGDNNALETMFSFSRASRADYYLLDGSVSNEEIIDSLLADQRMICIRITPDASQLDGGQKSIQAVLQTPEGDVTVTATVDMPFAPGTQPSQEPAESEPESEAVPDESEPGEPVQTEPETAEDKKELPALGGDTSGAADDKEKKGAGLDLTMFLIIAGAAAAALAIVIVVVIIVASGKKKKRKAQQAAAQQNANQAFMGGGMQQNGIQQNGMQQNGLQQGGWQQNAGGYGGAASQGGERTMILGAENNMSVARETVSLWGQQMQQEVRTFLVLRDTGRPNVMFKVPIRDTVRIGRKEADIVVDYDKYVSARQCEIIKRGELLYIKDLGSANGTFYENVRIYDQETPIVSGGTIRIGQSTFTVMITKE